MAKYTKSEIIRELINIINNMLELAPVSTIQTITKDTQLFDGGIFFSSLDFVEFIIAIEQKFAISWPDEMLQIEGQQTIDNIAGIIMKLL